MYPQHASSFRTRHLVELFLSRFAPAARAAPLNSRGVLLIATASSTAALHPLHAREDAGAAAAIATVHGAATLLYVEDNLANLSLVETILLSRPEWRTVPALWWRLPDPSTILKARPRV